MKLAAFKYSFPFNHPFQVSGRTISHRKGLILTLKYGSESLAWGEAAPLPGFSNENLNQIEKILIEQAAAIESKIDQQLDFGGWSCFLDTLHLPPSLRFGLDTLFADFHSRQQKISFSNYFYPGSSDIVPVNAAIGISSIENAIEKTSEFWNAGYRTFKFKVGRNFQRESEILKTVRQRFPFVKIRIDANQAWTLEEAVRNLQTLNSLQIQYCEEPLLTPYLSNWKKLSKETSIPLAADESVTDFEYTTAILNAQSVRTLVLKPMRLGSIQKLIKIKNLAEGYKVNIVFTTFMESGVGRLATGHLASGLKNPLAQGLATGYLLKKDLWQDSRYIKKANFQLPRRAGLGISNEDMNLKKLKRVPIH